MCFPKAVSLRKAAGAVVAVIAAGIMLSAFACRYDGHNDPHSPAAIVQWLAGAALFACALAIGLKESAYLIILWLICLLVLSDCVLVINAPIRVMR
jgi:hypothetical protein